MVAGADGEAIEAQFMRLREEVAAGRSAFADMTIGHVVVEGLVANMDVVWEAYKFASK